MMRIVAIEPATAPTTNAPAGRTSLHSTGGLSLAQTLPLARCQPDHGPEPGSLWNEYQISPNGGPEM